MEVVEKPIISVLVPTYNHGPFIEQCLESIVNQQTEFTFEVLIGENESSDGTYEVCEHFARKYSDKVTLFRRSRSEVIYINGVATGRSNIIKLIQEAKGEFIAICEGDDYWLSTEKLQRQATLLQEDSKAAGSFHDTYIIYEDQSTPQSLFRKNLPNKLTTADTLVGLSPFHTSSLMFRKSCLKEFPDFLWNVVSFDMALFSVVSYFGYLAKVSEVYSVYRKHVGGITNTKGVQERFHDERIKLLKTLDLFHEQKYADVVDQTIRHHQKAKQVIRKEKVKRMFKRILRKEK